MDPRVSLLVVDPADTGRFIQIRGRAELTTAGAEEHLDLLARSYTAHSGFHGFVVPASQRDQEERVILRIHAERITLDAIHS